MESEFWHFVQLESLADYRRPGRPKGSRDRTPRKTNAKHGAAIRHMDSSVDQQGSTALKLRPFDDGLQKEGGWVRAGGRASLVMQRLPILRRTLDTQDSRRAGALTAPRLLPAWPEFTLSLLLSLSLRAGGRQGSDRLQRQPDLGLPKAGVVPPIG